MDEVALNLRRHRKKKLVATFRHWPLLHSTPPRYTGSCSNRKKAVNNSREYPIIEAQKNG